MEHGGSSGLSRVIVCPTFPMPGYPSKSNTPGSSATVGQPGGNSIRSKALLRAFIEVDMESPGSREEQSGYCSAFRQRLAVHQLRVPAVPGRP